jgi:hypothetical protein
MALGFVAPRSESLEAMLPRRASPKAILAATKHQPIERHYTSWLEQDLARGPAWCATGVGAVAKTENNLRVALGSDDRKNFHSEILGFKWLVQERSCQTGRGGAEKNQLQSLAGLEPGAGFIGGGSEHAKNRGVQGKLTVMQADQRS